MNRPIARRDALRHLAVFSASVVVPGLLIGCSKKTSCTDVSGLSPDEVNMRNNVAGYVEQTPDAAKKCNNCAQWIPAAPDACGGCKVVKGPINPEGWCKLYVAKPA